MQCFIYQPKRVAAGFQEKNKDANVDNTDKTEGFGFTIKTHFC